MDRFSGQSALGNSDSPVSKLSGFRGLDHLAIVVPDTEAALRVWRDSFGFPVLYSEKVNNGAIRLTHLDLGNTHLQLVEPLTPEHPLQTWLSEHGPGLHHFCLKVDDVGEAMTGASKLGLLKEAMPHQGIQGKRAVFLDASQTQHVQVELTGK
jgi:methylmalonyl-CoA/ethylmalonyl-CoA epimerase